MTRSRPLLAAMVVAPLAVGPLAAQIVPPPGWTVVLDAPARLDTITASPRFPDSLYQWTGMPPGWHITMGPGAQLFPPGRTADGRFRIESEVFLFPSSPEGEYGIVLGGRDLQDAGAAWTAFVVRGDGSAAIVRRAGGATTMLHGWTRHDAVRAHPGGDTVVRNVLRVTADADEVSFWANGLRVASLPRAQVPVDGQVGLRAGRGANLHVSTLDLLQHLAPAPARRPAT